MQSSLTDGGLGPLQPESGGSGEPHRYAIETEALSLWYGDFQALFEVDLQIKEGMITSLIGPSGCGKSTLLRTCNRIIERLGYVRTDGSVRILGHDVFAPGVEL
ncbi:MAG: ATP-binding cassette domain-containing protein, partial [Gemmatimonadetes bacterium]|nr:ATP-binding cassette domain-containing protein [Gemmatimonadota bacterium]